MNKQGVSTKMAEEIQRLITDMETHVQGARMLIDVLDIVRMGQKEGQWSDEIVVGVFNETARSWETLMSSRRYTIYPRLELMHQLLHESQKLARQAEDPGSDEVPF